MTKNHQILLSFGIEATKEAWIDIAHNENQLVFVYLVIQLYSELLFCFVAHY